MKRARVKKECRAWSLKAIGKRLKRWGNIPAPFSHALFLMRKDATEALDLPLVVGHAYQSQACENSSAQAVGGGSATPTQYFPRACGDQAMCSLRTENRGCARHAGVAENRKCESRHTHNKHSVQALHREVTSLTCFARTSVPSTARTTTL